MMQVRLATFNLGNVDETVPGQRPTLAERITLMRPQVSRLRADMPARTGGSKTPEDSTSQSHRLAPRVTPLGSGLAEAMRRSFAAALFSASNSASSFADPMRSISRDSCRDEYTICTAAAPEPVLAARTYATI
jgi:hypothetical protein